MSSLEVCGAARGLTSSGRRNYVFFYGVSPSNPLAFQAAARIRRSHASTFAKFPTSKQAKSKADRTSAQCHVLQALQPANRANLLGLHRGPKSFAQVPRPSIDERELYD